MAAITWNIASHASNSCPPTFGALQFPTKEPEVTSYFHIHYRITKWEQGLRRKREAEKFVLVPHTGEIVLTTETDSDIIPVRL